MVYGLNVDVLFGVFLNERIIWLAKKDGRVNEVEVINVCNNFDSIIEDSKEKGYEGRHVAV